MRILHLLPPGFGGIDAYVFSHYKYMDREKFHFDFITRNLNLQNAAQYRDYPYTVQMLPGTAAEDRDGFIRAMREILGNGYDVLHLHTSFWTGTLIEEIAQDAGIRKVIVHSHSTYIEENDDEKRERFLRQHNKIKATLTPDLATDYWSCSRKAADWLFGSRIPSDRIKIMNNAIELEKYQFHPKIRSRVRMELGIGEAVVFGTVGRISYQKNHGFLVDTFAEFHGKHQNCKLMIVGDGELRGELQAQIREKNLEDAVLLLGWKTNVENYLQAMDCFLLPSRFEGFPISVIEAAASGLQCIVSDNVTDEVTVSNYIQRKPLDVAAWESAIDEILKKAVDRQAGGMALRAAGYDIKQQAKVLERMYED